MSSETLEEFAKKLPKMPEIVQKKSLSSWNRNTLIALGLAKQNAPLTVGSLMDSLKAIKARITPKGLVSFIISKLPYAKVLEIGKRDGVPLNYKSAGEFSYYLNGAKRLKKRKGGPDYVGRGIEEIEDKFVDEIGDIIGEVWKGL